MAELELIEYIELDLTPCSLSYGVYPCTAVLGVDSTRKCFNSPATCPVPQDFSAGDVVTHRFAKATQSLPDDIVCIPNIVRIDTRAQEARPGRAVPVRESVDVTFSNHRHNDAGYDNYLDERDYNTYNRGTHWGKFSARWPNIQGAELRHLVGEPGDALSDFETRHYYVESTAGPDGKGIFKIVAKDAFKFFDGKKAQMPKPSTGRLSAALAAGVTSCTIVPAGTGDAEYPASGTAAIGGEIVTFTRSGDDFTIVRGQDSTDDEDHDEDETVQLCEVYTAEDPAEILDDMIFGTHADGSARTQVPLKYRNLAAWQTETDTYFGRLYSATIARPTPIGTLVSEIIQHAGLNFYPDIIAEVIRLQVLRQGVVVLAVTDDIVRPGSLMFRPLYDKRISAVWTSFGQKNPLLNLDEDGNYRSIASRYDDDPVKLLEGLPEAIERTRSRWITVDNRVAANEFNQFQLLRWGDTPGQIGFAVPVGYPVKIGANITFQSRMFEDDIGDERAAQPAIVTQVRRTPAWYECKADTIKFRPVDTYPGNTSRVILIDEDALNVNLRTLHDLIYVEPDGTETIDVIIGEGVTIGASPQTAAFAGNIGPGGPEQFATYAFGACDPAFDVGTWPSGVTINIENNGRIFGGGGRGGFVSWVSRFFVTNPVWATDYLYYPSDGGVALYTRHAITLDNQGEIWGGGGGGGGNNPTVPKGPQLLLWTFGGNGAGHVPATVIAASGGAGSPIELRRKSTVGDNPGNGGYLAVPSTSTETDPILNASYLTNTATGAGGAAGAAGTDGDSDGSYTHTYYSDEAVPAGAAGASVDGDSLVTYTTAGDLKGPQIN